MAQEAEAAPSDDGGDGDMEEPADVRQVAKARAVGGIQAAGGGSREAPCLATVHKYGKDTDVYDADFGREMNVVAPSNAIEATKSGTSKSQMPTDFRF